MTDLEHIINSPEQKAGEFWQQASRIIANNPELLERVTSADGEEEMLISPSFTPGRDVTYSNPQNQWRDFIVEAVEPVNKTEKRWFSQSYSVAAQVNPGKDFIPGSPLYLIINGQTTNPLLKFERMTSGLMVLDGSATYDQLENSNDSVSKILGFIEKGLSTKQKSLSAYEEIKKQKRKALRGVALGFATFGLLVGGGVKGFTDWRTDLAADAAEERADFDALDINIAGEGVGLTDLDFIESDPSFFTNNDVPSHHGDEDLDNPRRFSVTESECEPAGTLEPGQEQAFATTEGPNEQLYLAVNSNGVVQVCSFDSPGDNDEDSETHFDVAVQIREIVAG